MSNKQQNYNLVPYQTENGSILEVTQAGEDVWLTQKQIVELFQSSKTNVSEHISRIFEEGELDENSVVRNFRTTAEDGKNYNTKHYNLKAIRMISGAFTQLGATIMATPVGWLAAGVAAIVVGAVLIRKYWTPITQLFKGIWEGIKTSLKPAFDSIGEALKPLSPVFQVLGGWISNAWNWFTKLIVPVNTTGKASHDLGVKIGGVIGGLIKLGGNFVWFLARINPITGPLIAIWQNFDKIKNAITGAGNALKNFFSRFGNKKITASVSVDEKVSGKGANNKVDGSHADGLSYVPFNGYTAELHRGERVITAQENKQYSNTSNTPIYVTFSPVINADSNTDTSSIAKIVEKECNKLIAKIQEQQRRRMAGAYA